MSILFRVMFALACGVIGFAGGGLIGAELVPLPHDALAAAAKVATFASGGGLTGIVSGALLGRRVPDHLRVRGLLIVTLIATALVAGVTVRGAARRRHRIITGPSVSIALDAARA